MYMFLGFDDYYCQDNDDITCPGFTKDDCLSLGCCWDTDGCTHSMGECHHSCLSLCKCMFCKFNLIKLTILHAASFNS